MVEHLHHHHKVEGSSLAATGTVRDKMPKSFIVLAIGGSTVVEYLPHSLKEVEGSNLAATGIVRKNMAKKFYSIGSSPLVTSTVWLSNSFPTNWRSHLQRFMSSQPENVQPWLVS